MVVFVSSQKRPRGIFQKFVFEIFYGQSFGLGHVWIPEPNLAFLVFVFVSSQKWPRGLFRRKGSGSRSLDNRSGSGMFGYPIPLFSRFLVFFGALLISLSSQEMARLAQDTSICSCVDGHLSADGIYS